MNFFIDIFQGFWLQISEHLFSRTPLKWLLLQRRIQDLVKMELFGEYNERLKAVNNCYLFSLKSSISDVSQASVYSSVLKLQTSSIYQTYKFKVYCNSFWRHCNAFDVIFSHRKETLCLLSNVVLSRNLELLCNCMFATNAKTIIQSIGSIKTIT